MNLALSRSQVCGPSLFLCSFIILWVYYLFLLLLLYQTAGRQVTLAAVYIQDPKGG